MRRQLHVPAELPGDRRLSRADFFVIRTPLLAFDEFLAWSGGASSDAASLRERLRVIVARDDVREALSIASPELVAQLGTWERDPGSRRGRRIEQALVRYVTRMMSRPTPFALCAGYSIGRIGDATSLVLAGLDSYERRTPPRAASPLLYRANTTLHRTRGRYRYIESIEGRFRSVAVDRSAALDAALAAARVPVSAPGIAAAIGGDADAAAFVAQLIENQLLVAVPLPPEQLPILRRPAPHATLGRDVVAELEGGVQLLGRLFPSRRSPALAAFQERFVARFDTREVPLAVALDPEEGCGFGDGDQLPASLETIAFDGAPPPREFEVTPLHRFLLTKLHEVWRNHDSELQLDASELEAFASPDAPPLPDALAAVAAIAGRWIILHGAHGPSGAVFLGRFCDADDELRAHVERHLAAEEALRPEVVFAEVVHDPPGRERNVVQRPPMRRYEIVYGGTPRVPPERQLGLDDLRVSVRDGRIRLRSQRLDREVAPRMTHAHNFADRGLPLYRFLGLLQRDRLTSRAGWDWGALASAPFLPRVTIGRLIVAPAQWKLPRDEWRERRRLPRFVHVVDGDALLLIDFENPLTVEAAAALVRNRQSVTLVEHIESSDVHGPEGRFVHELIVPLLREEVHAPSRPEEHSDPVPRTFAPGSEWLYLKLYAGPAALDEIIRRLALPLARRDERWFFVRYADPELHLRLRVRTRRVKRLIAAANALLEEGLVWRVQLDTYEREIERYGAIELAEEVFHIDSIAAARIIDVLEPGEAGLEERWRLALTGVDRMLSDFGLDLEEKRDLMRAASAAIAAQLDAPPSLRHDLGDAFRQLRPELERLLAADAGNPLAPGLDLLAARSPRLAAIAAELRARTVPVRDVLLSFIHMYVNRMTRADQQRQELVIYDFLARLYESAILRGAPSHPGAPR